MDNQEELLQKEIDILAEMGERLQSKIDGLETENQKLIEEIRRLKVVEELPMNIHLPDNRIAGLRIKRISNEIWQVTYVTKGSGNSYYDIVVVTRGSTLSNAVYRMKKKYVQVLKDFKPEKVKPEKKYIWIAKERISIEAIKKAQLSGVIIPHYPTSKVRLTINYVVDTLELCKLQILKGIQIMRRFIQKNNTKN